MRAERATFDPDLGVDLLVGRRHRGVLPQRHRERARQQTGDTAEAPRCVRCAPAATPAISAVLLTRPSIAPKVAARSQPPVTSLWVVIELMRQAGRRQPAASTLGHGDQFNATRVCAGLLRFACVGGVTVGMQRSAGYRRVMTTTAGSSAQHAGRPLARREEPDARGTVQRDLPAALHPEHGDRAHQGRRAAEDHGRRRRRRGRFQQGARRQRRRRRRGHPDRDAGDVATCR